MDWFTTAALWMATGALIFIELLSGSIYLLMLAVRRVSVSAAALGLQVAGLIVYQRGHVMVVDREAMEAKSCKCYREIKARYDGLFELAD